MIDCKFHRFQRIQKDDIKPCAFTNSTEQTKSNRYQATVTRQLLPGTFQN